MVIILVVIVIIVLINITVGAIEICRAIVVGREEIIWSWVIAIVVKNIISVLFIQEKWWFEILGSFSNRCEINLIQY